MYKATAALLIRGFFIGALICFFDHVSSLAAI